MIISIATDGRGSLRCLVLLLFLAPTGCVITNPDRLFVSSKVQELDMEANFDTAEVDHVAMYTTYALASREGYDDSTNHYHTSHYHYAEEDYDSHLAHYLVDELIIYKYIFDETDQRNLLRTLRKNLNDQGLELEYLPVYDLSDQGVNASVYFTRLNVDQGFVKVGSRISAFVVFSKDGESEIVEIDVEETSWWTAQSAKNDAMEAFTKDFFEALREYVTETSAEEGQKARIRTTPDQGDAD